MPAEGKKGTEGDDGRPDDGRPDEERPEDELTVRDPVSAPDAEGRPRRATRRFPLFTRDTARPEGGGRAAPRDAPAPARQWPVLTVVTLVGIGLLMTALDVFRWGTLLIGVALLVGAVLRWAVPDVGMLAVRSRFTDIVTYAVLGLCISLLALMAQPKPVLQIPFLKDTLHFTVSQ
ncbi:membrane protein [Streptomyces flaveolus]|nr:membrane protein [Streptomyces flaveolus]